MRAADFATASLLILLGGVVIWDALRLGIGWGTDGPKSGFFPFWLAVLMVAVAAAILVQARRRRGRPFVTREQLRPVLEVLAPATALVVAMHWIGLYAASAVYIGFSMRWIGRHSWASVAAVSVGVPVVTFLIFERWFLVPMPKGPLEHWLGY